MNVLVVPDGTYEVCSRTINAGAPPVPPQGGGVASGAAAGSTNAKWILNVLWQMRGIDIHLDTNIGKRLSAIGSTVTTLAGEQGLDALSDEASPAEVCRLSYAFFQIIFLLAFSTFENCVFSLELIIRFSLCTVSILSSSY